MAVVFVSHASADEPFVRLLFDFLQTACDLRREDIFCTSIEDAGIETGADFVQWIGDSLKDAELALLVLTPNYFASRFCLAEMGAAWALEKSVFPLMLGGVDRDPGVVFMRHQSAVFDQQGLDNLRDVIARFHPEAGKATARWTVKRDELLDVGGEALEALPEPAIVSIEAMKKAEAEAGAAKALLKEANSTVRELRDKNEKLAALKDPRDVATVEAAYGDAADRLEAAEKDLRSQLNRLDRVEVRALYAAQLDEDWYPHRDTWDYWTSEIETAVRSGWLKEHETVDDQFSYRANLAHPRYREVGRALDVLAEVIESIPEDERERMEEEHGWLIDPRNYQYWQEAIVEESMLL